MTNRTQSIVKNTLFISGIMVFLWVMAVWNQVTIYTNSIDSYWQHVQHQLLRRYYVVLQLEKGMLDKTNTLNKVLDASFRDHLLQSDTHLSVRWANSVEQEIQGVGMGTDGILVNDAPKQSLLNELNDIESRLSLEVYRYNQSAVYVQKMHRRVWYRIFFGLKDLHVPVVFEPYYIFGNPIRG